MSDQKLKDCPIAERIAYYEREIERMDEHIARIKLKKAEMQRYIRQLQKPEAEVKYQQRMNLKANANKDAERKEKEEAARHARNRARIERELEACLRMNGKIA